MLQVIAHSVGAWNAYEFLVLARQRGLPMPQQAFLSAMAAPSMAESARPWRKQQDLDEAAFQASAACDGLRAHSAAQTLLRLWRCCSRATASR